MEIEANAEEQTPGHFTVPLRRIGLRHLRKSRIHVLLGLDYQHRVTEKRGKP